MNKSINELKTFSSFIITLTGPSSSGKSYVMQKILEFTLTGLNFQFSPVKVPKYSTRAYRAEEIASKRNKEYVDIISVDEIPKECDLVYRTYGKEYGLETATLNNLLNQNQCPLVVINDIRAVEELKKSFNGRVLSLFLFRRIPNIDDFEDDSKNRGNVDEKEYKDRYEKAIAMYRMYIENITIFNRVILNVKRYENKPDEKDYTKMQIENILLGVFNGRINLNKHIEKEPRLFIISGNASSGKDDVIKAVRKMGRLQAEILPKYTSRRQADDDGDEMICQYIPKKDIIQKKRRTYAKKHYNISRRYASEVSNRFKKKCMAEFTDEERKRYNNFEDFCAVQWEIDKLRKLRAIERADISFWREVSEAMENLTQDKDRDRTILNNFFSINKKYMDLNQIYEECISNCLALKKDCYLISHTDNEYIVYSNNKDIKYGFTVNNLEKDMSKDKRHRVLVASLVEIFNICKNKIGKEKVVTIYAYSQINEKEFVTHTDREMAELKKSSHDDLIRYSENIVDFDYVIIYAETKMRNESGGQKEELIDQMFRLFRAY